jgi:CO/xanthine dehydrogenase FAD-binding subunit
MKASDFIYHRASSIEEAAGLLDDYDGDARILAGGQSLVPMLNMRLIRPAALIDINGVAGLDAIEAAGDETIVGPMTRHVTVETSPVVAERLPLLSLMIRHVADRQVRNRGTIGGSLVQADPTGEMPLACLVLGARATVRSARGEREIAMRDFFVGSYATALEPTEILWRIVFPKHPPHFAFHEINRRHNDFAVISIAATGRRNDDGLWTDVRIGLGGMHDTPVLAEEAGALLEGRPLNDDDLEAAAAAVDLAISPPSDMRASEEYRRHLASIHVPRVLKRLRSSAENARTEMVS